MTRHIVRATGLVVALVALLALAMSAPARGNSVTAWNENAVNALINTAGQAPPVATVHLAMVHGAVYDAVNANRPRSPAVPRVAAGERHGTRRTLPSRRPRIACW